MVCSQCCVCIHDNDGLACRTISLQWRVGWLVPNAPELQVLADLASERDALQRERASLLQVVLLLNHNARSSELPGVHHDAL